jgi:micrococcal nuclease
MVKPLAFGLVAVAAAAAVAVGGVAAAAGNENKGKVVRVIDGDTLVIDHDHREDTVRLLNIDTPETKDPDAPVECLGPEATEYLQELLPAGSTVTLDFDVEREDKYGRTLAAVFADGELVNADIARQGLGDAVYFAPNQKYLAEVETAQAEARSAGRGLYDSSAGCTVPAQVSQAVEEVSETAAAPAGTTSAKAGAAAGSVAAAVSAAKKLKKALKSGAGVLWRSLAASDTEVLNRRLDDAVRTGEARYEQLKVEQAKRHAAEQEAAEKKAEARRKAAAEKAARQRAAAAKRAAAEAAAQAAAASEAAQAAAAAEAARQAEAEQSQQQQYQAPADPYPGYTGPRCYAPGGKTWKPCP